MINAIITWSLKNRLLVLILAFLIVFLGIYSIKHISVDAIPDLSDIQVIVQTHYAGQAPQVVEDQVTYPLTTAMLAVPGAVVVRGYSFFGDSYIYILFDDHTDLYWARSRVLEALSQIQSRLPSSAKPRLGPDATGVGWVYQYALVDRSNRHDLSQLTSIQNWFLKNELQILPGVAEVATVGGMVKQYQIELKPNRMRAYGLTIAHVKHAIQQANQESGGSVVEMAEAEYMVRAKGYVKSLIDLKDIPVGRNKKGVPIFLSDIASIQLGPQIRRGITDLNGQGEAVGGIVVMRYGSNALKTIEAVQTKLQLLKKSLPTGVEIVQTYNRAKLIESTISTLRVKLIEELLIVTVVCALFLLHFRSSLIVVLLLPVGILMAFSVMYYQNISANIMSLGGIAIAMGAMADGAIVLIENFHKQREHPENANIPHWQLVKMATLEVGPALFFSLLIVTLSFLPVFSLTGQEGRLFIPLAYTKTYAMAAAALLSITLVPVLMGYLIRGKIIPEARNPLNRVLIAFYRPVIQVVLNWPKTIIVMAIFLVGIGCWPLFHLGTEFMPDLNEGDLMYMPTTFPAISAGKAQQLLQQTDRLIKTIPEVDTVFGKIGRAETATDPAPLTMIETMIQFKPSNEWRKGLTPQKLIRELDNRVNFPGITNAWVMPIKTRIDMLATGIKTPLGIKISGPSLKIIDVIGRQIETILKPLSGTASVYSERVVGGRYITVDINRRQAARYGLSIADIQNTIQFAIGGLNVTESVEGLERYPVNLRFPQATRDSLSAIRSLPMVTPSGLQIPLSAVASIAIEQGPALIKTENTKPTGWVLVDVQNRSIGDYIQVAKRAIDAKVTLPSGYSIRWSGQYEYMQRAKERLQYIVPVTLIIIVLLLYFNFRCFSEVFIILGTLPMALVGGIWLLYFLHYNLSVAVAVGFIALIGVSIELGVVLLVYLNQAYMKIKQENDGVMTKDILKLAIMQGSLMRLRPIMMTVLTIILGLLPILFGSGTGAEVMQRIAAPLIGGMVSAVLLTLTVIPAVYFQWKTYSKN